MQPRCHIDVCGKNFRFHTTKNEITLKWLKKITKNYKNNTKKVLKYYINSTKNDQ